MNRAELIEAYAENIVDGLDMDALVTIAYETFVDRLESYNDEELTDEIKMFAPDLLENTYDV